MLFDCVLFVPFPGHKMNNLFEVCECTYRERSPSFSCCWLFWSLISSRYDTAFLYEHKYIHI